MRKRRRAHLPRRLTDTVSSLAECDLARFATFGSESYSVNRFIPQITLVQHTFVSRGIWSPSPFVAIPLLFPPPGNRWKTLPCTSHFPQEFCTALSSALRPAIASNLALKLSFPRNGPVYRWASGGGATPPRLSETQVIIQPHRANSLAVPPSLAFNRSRPTYPGVGPRCGLHFFWRAHHRALSTSSDHPVRPQSSAQKRPQQRPRYCLHHERFSRDPSVSIFRPVWLSSWTSSVISHVLDGMFFSQRNPGDSGGTLMSYAKPHRVLPG